MKQENLLVHIRYGKEAIMLGDNENEIWDKANNSI